ncbi:Hypothetical predicted protein [Octopus vulgaris]|uniref:Uncharacterized protein n=1 Tax=Octopus vulgaris TaxID=6645 RepID=A0AA36AWF8_OCTVU|nr:Hypothetical predicted protein [Octopus vulgaris]
MHPPRKYPAYNDSCNKKEHWKKFCRQRNKQNRTRQENGNRKRARKKFHDIESSNKAHTDSEEENCDPYHCIQISSMRNEAFATLDIIYPLKEKGLVGEAKAAGTTFCSDFKIGVGKEKKTQLMGHCIMK